MNFSKVGTTDYYCQYDGLRGYPLVEGEEIEVKFPSGKLLKTTVRQEKGRGEEYIDMNGHPDSFPTSKAYISVWNGTVGMWVKIYLNNNKIKVRRLNKPVRNKGRFWHDGEKYHW